MVTIKKWQEYWYMENGVFTCRNLSLSMKFTFEVTEEFPHSETSCYNYNSTATVCTLKIIFKDTIISHFQFSFVYE